ncbi:MAG: Ppx/GppA phosphatase family protein [Flavobacteriales bacterium]|jgi:exopolyphosphatase/guanosine-5'-triphosphate,3'-diphosphate pyrophosphatase
MKFAAIDIGTNAVRLLIKEIKEVDGILDIRKVSFTRVSLRLGEDVFETGEISEKKARNLIKVMRAFWYLMDVNEIEWFKVCATSAMREAQNVGYVIDLVKNKANIDIEIIDGQQEADLIFRNFSVASFKSKSDYLYIDVGGGSLELTLIRDGKRLRGKSFQIGTIRVIKGVVKDGEWDAVEEFVKHESVNGDSLMAIGTGGNINRIQSLIRNPKNLPIHISKIEAITEKLKSLTFKERVEKFSLKLDRADVIIPAAEIYLKIMKLAGAKEIIVPKVGLSDGIILKVNEEYRESLSD